MKLLGTPFLVLFSFRALSDEEDEEDEPQIIELKVSEPEDSRPFFANVSCIICQTRRRSNGSIECGHSNCHNCYEINWKSKRQLG
jgi:hypothetical protein